MRYAKSDPAYKAGYRAAQKSALTKAWALAGVVEASINASSGLSPLVWTDRERREDIVSSWAQAMRIILETV